jgi:hypothetical protein
MPPTILAMSLPSLTPDCAAANRMPAWHGGYPIGIPIRIGNYRGQVHAISKG